MKKNAQFNCDIGRHQEGIAEHRGSGGAQHGPSLRGIPQGWVRSLKRRSEVFPSFLGEEVSCRQLRVARACKCTKPARRCITPSDGRRDGKVEPGRKTDIQRRRSEIARKAARVQMGEGKEEKAAFELTKLDPPSFYLVASPDRGHGENPEVFRRIGRP